MFCLSVDGPRGSLTGGAAPLQAMSPRKLANLRKHMVPACSAARSDRRQADTKLDLDARSIVHFLS
jgi:hypothetical protein